MGVGRMDDREVAMLVARVQEGDAPSFQPIVREFTPPLYNLARKMLSGSEDAADAVQESFYRAYRDIAKFDGRTRFFSWLYGICVNVCYDAGKRRKRHMEREAPLDEGEAAQPEGKESALEILESRQIQEALRACLQKIPAPQRAALLLRYQEDLSVDEVAQALDIGLSAAKMRISRGLSALQAVCKDSGMGGTP